MRRKEERSKQGQTNNKAKQPIHLMLASQMALMEFQQGCLKVLHSALFVVYTSFGLVPGSPDSLTRNCCVTFELTLAYKCGFKDHAIIAHKRGSLGTRLQLSYMTKTGLKCPLHFFYIFTVCKGHFNPACVIFL